MLTEQKLFKAKIIMTKVSETNGIDKSNLVRVNEDQFNRRIFYLK